MNEAQKAKQEQQHRTQVMQALKNGHQQFVTVVKGKTPKEKLHFPNLERNCTMKFTDSALKYRHDSVTVEHYRDGKLLRKSTTDIKYPTGRDIPYDIVNEGLNNILSVAFNAGTQITAWYIGLIDNTGYSPGVADDDTYDDINQAGNGWDEFTSYTDANNADNATTRPLWSEDAPSSQSITNGTTKAIYDITAGGTVKGVFVCGGIAGAQTKGDHAPGGTLWATALFSGGDVTVSNGDQLKITYTVNAAHA